MKGLFFTAALLFVSHAYADALPPCTYQQLVNFAGGCDSAKSSSADKEKNVDQQLENVQGVDPKDIHTFLDSLKEEVASDDSAAIAKMVRWPLRYQYNHSPAIIRNADEFKRKFGRIFDVETKAAIQQLKYEDVSVDSNGIMFGGGVIWIAPFDVKNHSDTYILRIITVNNVGDGH